MAVFSTNQVRQLYVVTAVQGTAKKLDGKVTSTDAAGTIALNADSEGKNLFFQYMGATKTPMRSDLINLDNILHVKAVSADDKSQKTPIKQVKVALDADVNGGVPISGQDYILRITINPYVGMSDEEPYFKYGVVHATRAMADNTALFYTKLAASLYKNFSKELGKMLEFTIAGKVVDRVRYDANGEEVLVDTTGADIDTEAADSVIITEVEQEWTPGIKEQTFVNFTVTPTEVTFDGEDVRWGTVTKTDSGKVRNNGRKIADLEYFCMGERGDQYRNIGWPNSIPTKYLVDADTAYNILEIHYAYVGANEGPQRSEKDITIVCANKANLNKLIGQLAAAAPSLGVKELV